MTVYGVLDAITSHPEVTSVALIGLALLGLVPALLTAAGATALVYLLLSVAFGPANVPEVSGRGPGKRGLESGILACTHANVPVVGGRRSGKLAAASGSCVHVNGARARVRHGSTGGVEGCWAGALGKARA